MDTSPDTPLFQPCKTCGIEKAIEEFWRGFKHCIECQSRKQRLYSYSPKARETLRKRVARWRAKNKERDREIARAYEERHPEKTEARKLLSAAVRRGEIVKPEECEGCGQTKRLQAHHEDYSKPLVVQWLCSLCHGMQHRKDEDVRDKLDVTPSEFDVTPSRVS